MQDVIRAVARSTPLPVTCKIRSGWNEEMRDPVAIALRCQDAGVRAHRAAPAHAHADVLRAARAGTRSPPSSQALDIPVLGNGDIKTPHDALRMRRETGCAGVMIARGSFGQPWIFDQTRDLLEGRPMRAGAVGGGALRHRARARAHGATTTSPIRRGAAIEFRKHLGWYVKGLPGSAELRKQLHAVTSLGEVEGIFDDYLAMPRSVRRARRRRDAERARDRPTA